MGILPPRIAAFFKKYPVARGMALYSISWPMSNVCQQLIAGKEELDLKETCRFAIFGSLFVAPTLFVWVKTAGVMFPHQNLATAIKKALVEQVMYSPFAISAFYVGMNLLEGNTLEKALIELEQKFVPTYKMGFMVWPAVQTINFSLIREKNRVVFTGMVSFFWTIFLSYMKQQELKRLQEEAEAKLAEDDTPETPHEK